MCLSVTCHVFQSTLPLRGATAGAAVLMEADVISIHTPLAGSDGRTQRHLVGIRISIHTPLAGSDGEHGRPERLSNISIHTPLAGSDIKMLYCRMFVKYFNPHSPCGERPQK